MAPPPSAAVTPGITSKMCIRDRVIAGMETGMFTYLCHPDLPLKSYPVFDSHVREMSRLICECASALHIPLEYNLAGLRLRGTVPDGYGYTSDAFWQIAAQYKCSAIIAADAHEPDAVSYTHLQKDAVWRH